MPDVNLQLRIRLQETAGGYILPTDDWQLQWEKNASGTWTNVAGALTPFSRNTTSQQSGFGLDTTSNMPSYAQSVIGNGQALSRARMLITQVAGPNGTVRAQVWASDAGTFGGTAKPTGSPLTSSTTIVNSASLPTNSLTGPYTDWDFDGTFTLTNGVVYWIGITTTNTVGGGVLANTSDGTPVPGTSARLQSGVWTISGGDLRHEFFTVTSPVPSGVLSYESANLTDGAVTTNRLGAGAGAFIAGEVGEFGLVADLGWAGNAYTEVLYSVTLKAADLAPDDTLRFRVLRNGATTGFTYTAYPSITIGGGVPGWSASPADTATGSDSAVPVQDFLRTPADTAAGSDTATRAFAFTYDLADTAAGSDSAVAGLAQTKNPADTAAGADAHTEVQTFLRTPGDTAAGADSAVPVQTFDRTASDLAGGSDSVIFDFLPGATDRTENPTDLASSTDAASLTWGKGPLPADTAAGGDLVTTISTDDRTPADTAAGSDSVTTGPDSRVRVAADGANGSDLADAVFATGAINRVENPADLAAGADAVLSGYDRTKVPADTAAGADSVLSVSAGDRTPTDTAAGADSLTTVKDMPRTPADTAAGLDIGTEVQDYLRTPGDTAAGADSVSVGQAFGIIATVDDTAVGSDSLVTSSNRDRTADDLAGGNDSVTAQRTSAGGESFSDNANGSDSLTTLAGRDRQITDTAAGADAVTDDAVAVRTPADLAAGADSFAVLWDRLRVPADSAMGTEMLLNAREILIADNATGSDVFAMGGSRDRVMADIADGSDAATVQRAGAGSTSAADVAAGDDTLALTGDRPRSASDTAAGTDSASALIGLGKNPADVATAMDLLAVTWVRQTPLSDVADGADVVVATSSGARVLVDLAGGADDVTSERVLAVDLVVTIVDLAYGSDDVITREREGMSDYCWPIDTSCCAEFADYDENMQKRASELAGATLQMLTGYRVGGCATKVRPCRSSCVPNVYYYDGRPMMQPYINGPGEWLNVPCGCGQSTCGCGPICQLELPGPIGEIVEVMVNGSYVAESAYRVDDGRYLVRTDGQCWPDCQDLGKTDGEQGTFSVTYLRGVPVDALGAYVGGLLACEYAKACSGAKCRLPSGVTQITRQGVSMTLATAAFPGGMTGIHEVDVYVQSVNPHGVVSRPTIWTPDMQTVRTTTWSPM